MQIFNVHPKNPQLRLIRKASEAILNHKLVIYQTDSSYAIACHLEDQVGQASIKRFRSLSKQHHFTIMCKNLQQIGKYACMSTPEFRLIKSLTPGPYTFILTASKLLPKRLKASKRKTIGIRLPDNPVAKALLTELDLPFITSSLILPNESLALASPDEIAIACKSLQGVFLDSGLGITEQTTVVDFYDSVPHIIREGLGTAIIGKNNL